MEENFKNKLGFWTFCLLVIFLLVGGYFFTQYMINEDNTPKENSEIKNKSYKIDEKKEYIYFINEEIISEGAEIYVVTTVRSGNSENTANTQTTGMGVMGAGMMPNGGAMPMGGGMPAGGGNFQRGNFGGR